jgi:6-phosphogluconolactonase (cycloisomerase 2 family)
MTLFVSACGGGGGGTGTVYTVGGTVSGLSGGGLVLQDNGGNDLAVGASGPFAFATPLPAGSSYAVTVSHQPTDPTLNCVVMNVGHTGLVTTSNVSTAKVICTNIGRFAYVGAASNLVGFRIDPITGALGVIEGGTVGSGGTAAIDPRSRFLYLDANVFSIDAMSGALSPTGSRLSGGGGRCGPPASCNGTPVFAPDGQFAYGVMSYPPSPGGDYPDQVYAIAVNPNSGATAPIGSPITAGVTPSSVAVDPNGKYIYVASPAPCVSTSRLSCTGVGPPGLWSFAIDPVSGELANIAGSPLQGLSPFDFIAVEPSGRFLYVAGPNSGGPGAGVITALAVNTATGSFTPVMGSPYAADDPKPGPLLVDPSGSFLFVPNSNANSISAYAIDAASGTLKHVAGSPFPTPAGPSSLVFDPSGKFAYITHLSNNQTDLGSITGWKLDGATGTLSPLATNPVASGVARQYIALHPNGKFAYVANSPSGISAYAIAGSTTGALSVLDDAPAPTGSAPNAVAISPSGKFAYIANSGSNSVSAYTIAAASGGLTPVASSPYPSGTNPSSYPFAVAVDPGERFVYVTNLQSNNISAYVIDAQSGALTPVAGSPFPADFPHSVAIDPQGKYAYVVTNKSISAYMIDPVSGALAPIAGSPFTTLPYTDVPYSAAVDPSGHYLYLGSAHGVFGFNVDAATGVLTPMFLSSAAIGSFDNIVIDSSGRFVYATNYADTGVSAFTIDAATGALTLVAGSPIPAGGKALNVTIDSRSTRAYVACAAGIWVYAINAITGALTPIAGTPTAVGLISPGSISIAR